MSPANVEPRTPSMEICKTVQVINYQIILTEAETLIQTKSDKLKLQLKTNIFH